LYLVADVNENAFSRADFGGAQNTLAIAGRNTSKASCSTWIIHRHTQLGDICDAVFKQFERVSTMVFAQTIASA
jgi:hypothetical protein